MDKSDLSSWNDLPLSFKCSPKSGNTSDKRRSWNNTENFDAKVEEYFDKRFNFQISENDWQLPQPDAMFQYAKWKENHLQKMKHHLNMVKNKLNNFNLDDWHKHTRSNNKAGDIHWKLRNEYELEFVTQAWCKFYENISSFPLLPDTVDSLLSVHLCEAPGAFIVSLNHYLKVNRPGVTWDWLATTLNPYYEGNPLSNMINDDRFILHTLDHWNFGMDMTGNLMLMENMTCLVDQARGKGEVMLVTADGSIDCQEDPGEQEAVVAALHYCEVVAALHILAKGGSLLLKMFTMFECDTICLMYLLCCSFESVTVNKPATSKEGNSEVYVVCLAYRGSDVMEPWLAVLDTHYGPKTCAKSMFISGDIPSTFLDQLEDCAAFFMKHQVDTIENNIATYNRKNADRFLTKRLRHLIGVEFMERYGIRSLDHTEELVGRERLSQTFTLNLDPRSTDSATFNEMRRKTALEPADLLVVLADELCSLGIAWPYGDDGIKWLRFPEVQPKLQMQVGKPVRTIHSSKFCLGRLLKIRNQVLDLVGADPALASRFHDVGQECNQGLENHPGSFSSQLRHKFPGCTVLYFRESFNRVTTSDGCRDTATAEADAFANVLDAMDRLWRGDTLVLICYPLLTQLSVGLVRIIGRMFDRVGLVPPTRCQHAVVLHRFRHRDAATSRFLDTVEAEMDRCQRTAVDLSVLAVLPIDMLSGSDASDGTTTTTTTTLEEEADGEELVAVSGAGDFYKCVLEMNHACIVEQTRDIISQLLDPRAELVSKYHLDPTTD